MANILSNCQSNKNSMLYFLERLVNEKISGSKDVGYSDEQTVF